MSNENQTLASEYARLKEKHPGCVLLFRSGDFYKSLNDDAKKVSETLGIALIKPRNPEDGEFMAGFPHHTLYTYLSKLIRAGYRIAIVDAPPKQLKARKDSERKPVRIDEAYSDSFMRRLLDGQDYNERSPYTAYHVAVGFIADCPCFVEWNDGSNRMYVHTQQRAIITVADAVKRRLADEEGNGTTATVQMDNASKTEIVIKIEFYFK